MWRGATFLCWDLFYLKDSILSERSTQTKHFHNEEIFLARELAQKMSSRGCKSDVLLWAVVAGMSQTKEDINHLLSIIERPEQALKSEAMMVLVRLLLDSGNLTEARQVAADMYDMEHYVLHAFARIKIAKSSKEEEDGAVAIDVLRDMLEFLTQKS